MKIRERLEIVQINNDLNGAFLVSSLLILNIYQAFFWSFYCYFKIVNAYWVR